MRLTDDPGFALCERLSRVQGVSQPADLGEELAQLDSTFVIAIDRRV